MAGVDAADMTYSTGFEQYPESVFLHIAYANFLSTYRKSAGVSTANYNLARLLSESYSVQISCP